MRKQIFTTFALVITMLLLLVGIGCEILRSIPEPVWSHGLRIAGAIGREYIAERYDLDDVTRDVVNAVLREIGIDELPDDRVPPEVRESIRTRLAEQGYTGDELDALSEAGANYLLVRFELADIIDRGVERALHDVDAVFGEMPLPKDFIFYIRMELHEAGYSEEDIDTIIDKLYPEPDEVEAMAVEDPRVNTSYVRAVAAGLRKGQHD